MSENFAAVLGMDAIDLKKTVRNELYENYILISVINIIVIIVWGSTYPLFIAIKPSKRFSNTNNYTMTCHLLDYTV